MSVDRTTELIQKSMTANESGLVVTSYADDGVIRGSSFVFEKNFSISSGGTLLILVDYSTYTPTADQRGIVIIYPPKFSTSVGVVTVQVYRGTNYTGGVEFDAVNPNTTATKTTSGTTLTTAPTGTTKGTEVLSYLVGSESSNKFSGGGTDEGVSFFVRDNTAKTLVEISNLSGEDIVFHYGQGLFEI